MTWRYELGLSRGITQHRVHSSRYLWVSRGSTGRVGFLSEINKACKNNLSVLRAWGHLQKSFSLWYTATPGSGYGEQRQIKERPCPTADRTSSPLGVPVSLSQSCPATPGSGYGEQRQIKERPCPTADRTSSPLGVPVSLSQSCPATSGSGYGEQRQIEERPCPTADRTSSPLGVPVSLSESCPATPGSGYAEQRQREQRPCPAADRTSSPLGVPVSLSLSLVQPHLARDMANSGKERSGRVLLTGPLVL
ncbi:hypothetical protein RRG08_014817 [Elysia crispata]|uniref:Uncharacterized protein n=1 Tax=Elysia crispata TaxID=231223 RepID=A0AAE1DCZ5_9GAST|nr:hypothetical protein RRG08_014817 [Elysia crispata]